MFLPKFLVAWRRILCLAAAVSCAESQKSNADKRKHSGLRNLRYSVEPRKFAVP